MHEGAAPRPAPRNTTSAQRAATGADTDDNGADFTAAAPTPTPAGTGGGGGGTEPGPLRIHDIQGDYLDLPAGRQQRHQRPRHRHRRSAPARARASGSRTRTRTATRPPARASSSSPARPRRSPSATRCWSPARSATSTRCPAARLSAPRRTCRSPRSAPPTVTTVSTGNPLPAAGRVSARPRSRTPTRPTSAAATSRTTSITPTRSALDFYESHRGHARRGRRRPGRRPVQRLRRAVRHDQAATQAATYRGGAELLGENQTPTGRLEIVDRRRRDPRGSTSATCSPGADRRPDRLVDLRRLRARGARPSARSRTTTCTRVTATPGAGRAAVDRDLQRREPRAGRPGLEVRRRSPQGVVTNLATPDIVALEEIQDNSGATDNGVVAADQTLTKLTDAIAAAGGPHYAVARDRPGRRPGRRPAGRQHPRRLPLQPRPGHASSTAGGLDRRTGRRPARRSRRSHGTRADPLPGRGSTRRTRSGRPAASRSSGEFTVPPASGVFVIANHFDSKGGDQNADGRFQFPDQSSRVQRSGQAQVVHDFVQNILSGRQEGRRSSWSATSTTTSSARRWRR